MEEKENSKNNRAFYLTLAVVLAVVTILIIATVAARRSSDTPITDTESSSNTESETNPTISETDVLPEFSLPVAGEISIDYSDSVLVFSPTMKDWRTHLGVDVVAELGSEVLAVADGTVSNVWDDPFMGTCISIEHSGKAVSIYKNLSKDVGDGIVVGCAVKAGDVIGTVGETAMNEIAQDGILSAYNGAILKEMPNPYNEYEMNEAGNNFETLLPIGLGFVIPAGVKSPIATYTRGGLTSFTGNNVKTGKIETRFDLEVGCDVAKGQEHRIGTIYDTNLGGLD